MKISSRIIILIFLFLGSSLQASSKTILIETRDSQPRETMELPLRLSIVSAETGIMDSFFDRGHIFFNIYTSGGNPADKKMDQTALKQAREEGASHLLILIPDSSGITWKLYGVSGGREMATGYTVLDNSDPEKKIDQRWLSLGSKIADEVLEKLMGN